jgi:hypothetical protein
MRNKLKNGLFSRPMLIPKPWYRSPGQGTVAAHPDQFVAGTLHRFDVRQVAGFPARLTELDRLSEVILMLLHLIRNDQMPHLGYRKIEAHFVGNRFVLFRQDVAVASEVGGLLPTRRLHPIEIYHSTATHRPQPACDCQSLQATAQQQACLLGPILKRLIP